MATRNLTRKYVDIRNAQRANRVTGFHSNVIRVNGEDEGSLLETVKEDPISPPIPARAHTHTHTLLFHTFLSLLLFCSAFFIHRLSFHVLFYLSMFLMYFFSSIQFLEEN